MTVCDFNGDGHDDIAAGGINIEDEADTNTQTNQGGIQLYVGTANGLITTPRQILWGQRLNPATGGEGAVWEDASGLNMGRFLESADIDNDGYCDLVSADYAAKTASGRGSDGIVRVFKGLDTGGAELVASAPNWAIAAFDTHDPGKEFARMLTVADVDQDGFQDLLIGHHRVNIPNTSGSNHGALKIFLGGVLPDTPTQTYVASDAPDLFKNGISSWGFSGFHSAVRDVNQDGRMDLFIGHMRRVRGDLDGTGWQARGDIDLYFGPLSQDQLNGPADWNVQGTDSDDYFSAQSVPVNTEPSQTGGWGLVSYAPMHHAPGGQCFGTTQFVPMPSYLRDFSHDDSGLDGGPPPWNPNWLTWTVAWHLLLKRHPARFKFHQ